MNTPVINFTKEKFRLFCRAYKAAILDRHETFTFENEEVSVGYARFLIDYLTERFSRAG